MLRSGIAVWLACWLVIGAHAAPWSKTFAPADLHQALLS